VNIRIQFEKQSISFLLKTLKEQSQDKTKRTWAMGWLSALVEEAHTRGYFTERPWEFIGQENQEKAERRLAKEIVLYERWWNRVKNTVAAQQWLIEMDQTQR
jgi:hypothetical protein